MSFILDALKKSENERQRQIGPSLADVPARRKRNERPWWAFALAALLVVNLGVLAIVLVRSGGEADARPIRVPEPSTTNTPPTESTAPAQPAVDPRIAPAPTAPSPNGSPPIAPSAAVRSLADEALTSPEKQLEVDPANPDLAAAANVPAGPPMVRPIDPPAVAPLPSRPAYQPQAANETLPTHGSLIAGGTSLPDLRLDIHVYSPNPAERFVLVNMRKYTEGQTLSEGPAVERITSDGVVLNQQGLRFLLPRQ